MAWIGVVQAAQMQRRPRCNNVTSSSLFRSARKKRPRARCSRPSTRDTAGTVWGHEELPRRAEADISALTSGQLRDARPVPRLARIFSIGIEQGAPRGM